ncbi:hypothetical protein GE061_008929 [Apolygus lucorum]|uniref:Uncharacterized protein n=1 Tax=Apolygus lucorum TaxID=248454 RepID=A0A8S9XYS3_APOLU|nr:hypothetical protein GE061_008929 [Apolygus lucorum]
MGTFGGVDAQALLNGVGEIIKDYASGGQITVDSIIKAVSKIRVAPNPVDLSKIKVDRERIRMVDPMSREKKEGRSRTLDCTLLDW